MADRNKEPNHELRTGYSILNVLSNIAYAGMRAQNSENRLARALSFWVGFPGTLVTYFVVE